ncbi:LysE family translocator [Allomuricauda sp. SCSIO 65647]|uniref:LysE family translocator n=1 Tax=Allomuricauda sp. SCSIO 65647 TaxID=2908843 RepID=UPI001F3D65D4|nr:LysE family translocator [Muricauda sp. SCSIO 65647]UJH68893.1 LysE family translocator [Muricauda sp. SCSIO 65647]
MEPAIWLSFVGTVIILAITPGPSVLLATANSMKYGKGKTMGTIAGDLTANLCQIILASIGLATLVVSSGELFQIIKWCGVAYLIYMGITKIIAKPQIKLSAHKKEDRSFSKLFVEGFLMSAANPKAIVFFAALFPLFLNETNPIIPQIIILAITFLIIDGLSLFIYAVFAEKLKSYLENQEKVHLQNRIVGSLLILSGILLSLVKRTNH